MAMPVSGVGAWPGIQAGGVAVRVSGRWGRRVALRWCPTALWPSLLQDMLPMPGDPTQGTANYNIEDFADLGMFPPFSE